MFCINMELILNITSPSVRWLNVKIFHVNDAGASENVMLEEIDCIANHFILSLRVHECSHICVEPRFAPGSQTIIYELLGGYSDLGSEGSCRC